MSATQWVTIIIAVLGVISPGLKELLAILQKNKPAAK